MLAISVRIAERDRHANLRLAVNLVLSSHLRSRRAVTAQQHQIMNSMYFEARRDKSFEVLEMPNVVQVEGTRRTYAQPSPSASRGGQKHGQTPKSNFRCQYPCPLRVRVMPNRMLGARGLFPFPPDGFLAARKTDSFGNNRCKIPFSLHVSHRTFDLEGQYLKYDACFLHRCLKGVRAMQKCLFFSCVDQRLEESVNQSRVLAKHYPEPSDLSQAHLWLSL